MYARGVVPQDLLALPRFSAYARLLIDGSPSRAFSVETLPPPRRGKDAARPDVVRRTSQHRYCREAARIEAETLAAFAHVA